MLVVSSTVVAVTVHRVGAVVTREAVVAADGTALPTEVRIDGLPLLLDDASVQVHVLPVDGEAGWLPIAGEVRMTVAVPEPDARLPPPDDEALERARLDDALARADLDALSQALARIDRLTVAPRGTPEEGHPPPPSPTAARLRLLDVRRRRADALHARIADAKVRAHDTAQRLATLIERRRTASDDRNARIHEIRKAAIVRLQVAAEGAARRVRVRLRYQVAGARWAPSYTLRLDAAMTSAQLELRALVGQRTGEDWRGAELTLSTAHAQHWTELPEPKAIRIGRAQDGPPRTGWRPPPTGSDALYADYDRDLRRLPAIAGFSPAPVDRELQELAQLAETLADDAAMMRQAPPRPARPQPRATAAGAMPPPPSSAPPPLAMPAPAMPALPGAAMPRTAHAEALSTMAPQRKAASLATRAGGVIGSVAAAFGGGGDAHDLEADDGEPWSESSASAPAAVGLVASAELLDYGALWLPPADDPRRGKLVRVQLRDRYARHGEVGLADAALAGIERARTAAAAMDCAAPPAMHCWVDPEAGYDYAYVADAPVDVASDGALVSVPITRRAVEVSARFVSVPRETQLVFRVVWVRNPLDAPLLFGPADVYVGDRFLMTSDVHTTPPAGQLELGLGVEQAIKIARNVGFEEDTSGLLKRQHELCHTIKIDVDNRLPRTATVEVRERVPIAADGHEDDVQVVERDVQPPWDGFAPKDDPLLGGRRWVVDVPAGARRSLVAHWVVRIPSQHELVGGNRRES